MILFATPAYGGMITEPHFQSCLNLKEELTRTGFPHDWLTGRNESLVHRARMEMAASFLKTEYTHLFWIDSDIEFEPADVAKLWNLQTDIAVAAYSMKRADMPLSAWKNGKLVRLEECPNGPFEVDFAGTGFMLITRKAIEAVYDWLRRRAVRAGRLLNAIARSDVNLADDEESLLRKLVMSAAAPDYDGPHGRVPALFMTPIHNDGLESEDYHFCRIAREAGFKIIMDPSIRLGHWGLYRYG